MTLYDRPPVWIEAYGENFLGFCLDEMMMLPDDGIKQALRSMARYPRVGFAEAPDFPFAQITGAVVIWRMLTLPLAHHLILTTDEEEARHWFGIAEEMMTLASPRLRNAILFSRSSQLGMTTTVSRDITCAYLAPSLLACGETIPRWLTASPLTVICSDLDALPTGAVQEISKMLTHPDSLWVTRCVTKPVPK